MSDRIALIGGGGHALDVLEVVDRIGGYDVVGYYDDVPAPTGVSRTGLDWLGPVDDARRQSVPVVCAIGDPASRLRVVAGLDGVPWADALVHPRAEIASETRIGRGAVVMAMAVLSRRVQLGAHTHVSQHATIGHEAVLGRSVSVYPHAAVSGRVTIADGAMVGAGAVILQDLAIGAFARVGAGAVVVRNVVESSTVVGVGPSDD